MVNTVFFFLLVDLIHFIIYYYDNKLNLKYLYSIQIINLNIKLLVRLVFMHNYLIYDY